MTVFLVLFIPLLLMVFALLMERVENRLRSASMNEMEVEEFLDSAQPDEVNTFIREGWARALSRFRLRRRPHQPHSPLAEDQPQDASDLPPATPGQHG
jgi:hypothetical protein